MQPVLRATPALALALALAAGAEDPPAKSAVGARPPLEGWDLLSCAGCHEEIASEWARSGHAHAWVGEAYQRSLEGRRRPESCHGCHIPEPLHPGGGPGAKPAARAAEAEAHELGVSFRTCHLGPDGEMLGPRGADELVATGAHGNARSSSFATLAGLNELCASCHATTVGPVVGLARDFRTARLEEEGESCVGCHMPAVVRPSATVDEDHPPPPREGRSHLLRSPRDPELLAAAFELAARAEGEETVVTARNRAGHRVPGLVGRELAIALTALGEGGEELGREELRFDVRAPLPVGGERAARLPGGAVRVRAEGLHRAPEAEEVVRFLEAELPVEAP